MLPILSSPPASVQRKKRTACRSYYHPGAKPVKPTRFRKRGKSLLNQRSYQPECTTSPSVPGWSSRSRWLTALTIMLATPEGDKVRREISVKAATVLEVAKCDADAADNTGRDVRTSHASVAERLGCSTKTVQRARTLIMRLGLAIEALRGRYLTEAERIRAALTHGGRQTRCASTRHLTLPQTIAQKISSNKNVYLPSSRKVSPISSPSKMVTKRSKDKTEVKKTDNTDRSLTMQRLAAQLKRSMSWLLREKSTGKTLHIGHLLRILTQAGINPERTSATDIHRAIELTNGGRETLDGRTAHAPLGYFAHLLRQAKPTIDELAANKKYAENQKARRKGTCGHPDCDGHGFHNHKHADGTTTVSRCPHHAPIRLTPLEK